MSIYDALQLCGGIILSIGYIPQIVKLVQTKSAKDFNLASFASVCVAIFLMEIYAVHLVLSGSGMMYLITNSMSLAVQIVMLILICRYKYTDKYKEVRRR